MKCKSIIDEFPNYIKNYGDIDIPDAKNIPGDIMEELQNLKYKKNTHGPKFSPKMMRYSLLLYYTSPKAYRMLLEQFPFPSISLLKKLSKGGIEPLHNIAGVERLAQMQMERCLRVSQHS